MSRFNLARWVVIAAGVLPLPAVAGPNDAGSTSGKSSASNVLSGSEELGREAQRELARLGCFSGDVNASWGRESRAAVKRFGEATRSAWPDWPSSELIRSLWTFPDGHCLKCETCTTAAAEAQKRAAEAEAAEAERRRKAEAAAAEAERRQKAAEAAAAEAERRRKAAEAAAAEAERRRKAEAAAAAEAERRRKAEAAAAEAERRRKAEAAAAEAKRRRKAEAAAAEAERIRQVAEAAEAERRGRAEAEVAVRETRSPTPRQSTGNGSSGGRGWPNGGPADSVGR